MASSNTDANLAALLTEFPCDADAIFAVLVASNHDLNVRLPPLPLPHTTTLFSLILID